MTGTRVMAPMTRSITDSWLGRQLDGRWRVLELLSQGAMGRVYRAEHLGLGRQVAVKVLNDAASADEGFRLRFRREAMVVGRLAHPNIVGALDVGTHDDSLYLVLELLDGRPLDSVLREQGVFGLERVTRLLRQVSHALGAAHRVGVVHRDVKPANLMLVDTGHEETTKVVDFGIASEPDSKNATLAGLVLGTPNYAAPEQLLGRRVTPAADVYALGCTLYELLTGAAPFEAHDLGDVIAGHLHHAPRPLSQRRPDVPASLAALVHAMLEKDPAHRPADGLAVFDALKTPAPVAPASTSGVLVGVRLNDAEALRTTIALTNEMGLELTRVQGRALLVRAGSAELGFQAAERFVAAVTCATAVHEGPLDEGQDDATVRVALELLRLAPEGGVMVTRHAHASLGLGFRARLSNRRQRLVDGGAAGGVTVFELPSADLEAHAATIVRGVKTPAGVDFSCGCGTPGHVPSLSAGSARVRCAGCSGLLEVVAAEAEALVQLPSVIVAPALVEAPTDDDDDALILASLSSLTGAST